MYLLRSCGKLRPQVNRRAHLADFPYTPNPATLRRFFEQIQSTGVPSGVTIRYIESIGFKTKNDRYILATLKALKFVDDAGNPTPTWQRYRNKEAAAGVMASAMHVAYSDLFATYPDANRKDNEALRNFFSTHTKVGEAVLNLIVRTFKTLCELADFEKMAPAPVPQPDVREDLQKNVVIPVVAKPQLQSGMTVNINIQLQLQATEDASIYDKFFAAMKKHLFPSE